MALENLLTVGAITQILENYKPVNPVLQIIGYKPMSPDQMAFGTVTDDLRYRLMMGDGQKAHQYCVITNQDLVDDIRSGKLEKWAIVKVTNYQTVDYGDGPPENKRRLVYILNLECIKKGCEVGRKLTVNSADANNQQMPMTNQSNGANNFQQPMKQDPQQIYNRPAANNYAEPTQAQPYPMGGMSHPEPIRSPRNRSSYDQQTIGIGELTPYIGKWVVKGRVTAKSGIREYNNAKGAGKLFNFTLADKTGEIKVTAFNTDLERIFAYVEPNKVYLLGRATIKNADKRYTTADFEATVNSDTLLEEVVDAKETSDIPVARFNFVSIASLSNIPPNQPVDLIGAVQDVQDVTTIMSRTKNKELKKRNITIVDMTRHAISVTIWGEQADAFTGTVGDVFATKAARIGTYGGRSASAGDCLFINPDIPETRKIKNWYNNLVDTNFTSLTTAQDGPSGDSWKCLEQVTNLDTTRQAVASGQMSNCYGKCKVTLLSVGKNPVYKCCPTDNCGKKLVDTQNGELKCDKCQQTYSNYKYRYMTSVELADYSSSCWVTLWDEKAETILGMGPDDLERYMRLENKDTYERIIARPNFNAFVTTLRSKIDTYGGEDRVKPQVINISPLSDVVTYGKQLISQIKSFTS